MVLIVSTSARQKQKPVLCNSKPFKYRAEERERKKKSDSTVTNYLSLPSDKIGKIPGKSRYIDFCAPFIPE